MTAVLPDAEVLRDALERYPAVVAGQGVERLPELDEWYREGLPAAIAGRSPAHVSHADLIRVTEWKMARGVWRAPNLALVRGNDPSRVEEVSGEALQRAPHPTAPVAELAKLAGVGPATASAVAAAALPSVYPFFDELVAQQLPDLGPVAWTLRYYARYADLLRAAVVDLGAAWTPASLAHALWALAGGKAGV